MDSQHFEQQLAEDFRKYGYKPELTAKSSDRGIDILLNEGSVTIAVQAKYYSAGNRVGSPTIQKAAGLLQRPDIDGAVVVTTSEFTSEAKAVASNRGVKLRLADASGRLNSSIGATTSSGKKASEVGHDLTWEARDEREIPHVDCPNCEKEFQRTGWYSYVSHFLECEIPESKPEGLPDEKWERVVKELDKRDSDDETGGDAVNHSNSIIGRLSQLIRGK